MGEWETEFGGEQLLDVWTSDIRGLLNLLYSQYLRIPIHMFSFTKRRMRGRGGTYVNGAETSTMTGGHILIQRRNRTCARQISHFLVHVMCTRTRIVSHPDTKVLHFQWLLLRDLPSLSLH